MSEIRVGKIKNPKIEITGITTFSSTGYLTFPVGTTEQRPSSPVAGQVRFNSTLNKLEFYDTNFWRSV